MNELVFMSSVSFMLFVTNGLLLVAATTWALAVAPTTSERSVLLVFAVPACSVWTSCTQQSPFFKLSLRGRKSPRDNRSSYCPSIFGSERYRVCAWKHLDRTIEFRCRAAPRGAVLKSGARTAAGSSSKPRGWGLLLRRNRPTDLKVTLCTGGGFAQYLSPFDSDSVRDQNV